MYSKFSTIVEHSYEHAMNFIHSQYLERLIFKLFFLLPRPLLPAPIAVRRLKDNVLFRNFKWIP